MRRWFLRALALIAALIALAAIAEAVLRFMPVTRDGSNPRRAVVLKTPQEKATDAEYSWLAEHYPGGAFPAEIFHQMRSGNDGWVYSYYLLETPGERREVWFYTGILDKKAN